MNRDSGSMIEDTTPAPRRIREPSAAIAAVDGEVRKRFARRTDSLESFLGQWIRMDESQKTFFSARGTHGENYMQFSLAKGDTEMALALTKMCAAFAGTTDADRVLEHLKLVDNDGNDVWHYLADNLTTSEDDDSLAIAKILIQLDIDFCRKNDADESPLARLLIPEVRWQSINSLLQAKTLTIAEIDSSFSDHINRNAQIKGEIVTRIFFSDLADNEGRLTNHLLQQALSPRTEASERGDIAEAFFEHVGGNRSETVLMKMMETEHRDAVERMLDLLQRCAEDSTSSISAVDLQTAKAQQQIYIYRRLARRNRIFQSILTKCILSDHPEYIPMIMRMLRNEDLIIVKRNSRGETDREMLVVDKTSAAPGNPALSLLLQQDARGNLAFHTAVLAGRAEPLRKLFFGLSLIDCYAIVRRVPNRYGLTVGDLLSPKDAYQKLAVEIKAQRISVADAQSLLNTIKVGDKRVGEFLAEAMRKAEDVIARTGGAKVAKPTFDLSRIPTMRIARDAPGAAPGQRPAGPPNGHGGSRA